MIQTTIQNICAVDDYKKSRTSVSPHDAQSCSVNTSYSSIFPKTTTVSCGLLHICPFSKINMQKINHNEKKERKKKQGASQVYLEVVSTGRLVWQSLISVRCELPHLALCAGRFCVEFLVLPSTWNWKLSLPFTFESTEVSFSTD